MSNYVIFSQLAQSKAKCDFAVYVGAAASNAVTIPPLSPRAAGLKMYLNDTYTTLKLDDMTLWMEVRIELLAILYVDFSEPIPANQVQLRRKLTVNLLTTNVRVASS